MAASLLGSIGKIVAGRMASRIAEKKKKYGKTVDTITGKDDSLGFADDIVEGISKIGTKKKKKKPTGLPSRQMQA